MPDGLSAFSVKKDSINIGGTASFDDRDEDWNEVGYHGPIRERWDQIKSQAVLRTVLDVTANGAELMLLFVMPLIAVGGVLSLVLSGNSPPEGQSCHVSGPHVETDLNNSSRLEYHVRCKP
jgi:hypothetical protein